MAGVRPLIPPEFTKLSTRVALACQKHPQVFLTYTFLEMLAWGAESRTIEFDGDWFQNNFGIEQFTLLRHLSILSKQPIQAVLVYRSAGAGFRRFSITLAEMSAAELSGDKNVTVTNLRIPVVVVKDSNLTESLNTTTGDKNVTVTKTPPETPPTTAKPNIFSLHEQYFGPFTAFTAETLKDAEQLYPPEWIEAAFDIARGHNKRFWGYAEGILKRWQAAGKMTKQEKLDDTDRKQIQNPAPPAYGPDDDDAAAAVLAMQAAHP